MDKIEFMPGVDLRGNKPKDVKDVLELVIAWTENKLIELATKDSSKESAFNLFKSKEASSNWKVMTDTNSESFFQELDESNIKYVIRINDAFKNLISSESQWSKYFRHNIRFINLHKKLEKISESLAELKKLKEEVISSITKEAVRQCPPSLQDGGLNVLKIISRLPKQNIRNLTSAITQIEDIVAEEAFNHCLKKDNIYFFYTKNKGSSGPEALKITSESRVSNFIRMRVLDKVESFRKSVEGKEEISGAVKDSVEYHGGNKMMADYVRTLAMNGNVEIKSKTKSFSMIEDAPFVLGGESSIELGNHCVAKIDLSKKSMFVKSRPKATVMFKKNNLGGHLVIQKPAKKFVYAETFRVMTGDVKDPEIFVKVTYEYCPQVWTGSL